MMPSGQQLLIILLIIIVLFGAKKIPDLAKGLGAGIKNFKKAVKEEEEEVVQNTKIEQDKTASASSSATSKDATNSKPSETAKV